MLIFYKKRLNYPKIPSSADEIEILDDFALTEDKKRFLLSDVSENGERIIIFCPDWGLEVLSKCNRIHADGTFKTSPNVSELSRIISF